MSLDAQEVALYGEGYINYKARMKRELYDEVNDQESTSDEEEDPAKRFM
jgi:hypothetical protein